MNLDNLTSIFSRFFFFGAFYFDCDDEKGKLGRFWWLALPMALLVVFPLGAALTFEPESAWLAQWIPNRGVRPMAVMMQALYPWLMTFGLIGLFRRICTRENKVVRYVSDSSYWLYIAHIPVIFLAQATVKPWDLPACAKFASVCVGVTAVLLVTYDLFVRYTWIGTLLNGKRTRPSKKNAEGKELASC